MKSLIVTVFNLIFRYYMMKYSSNLGNLKSSIFLIIDFLSNKYCMALEKSHIAKKIHSTCKIDQWVLM